MIEKSKSDEKIKKLIDDSIDEIDSSMRKIGLNISNLLTKISEDKIGEIWEKGKIILKQKLKRE